MPIEEWRNKNINIEYDQIDKTLSVNFYAQDKDILMKYLNNLYQKVIDYYDNYLYLEISNPELIDEYRKTYKNNTLSFQKLEIFKNLLVKRKTFK